jgi:serine/threonine-protein kinase
VLVLLLLAAVGAIAAVALGAFDDEPPQATPTHTVPQRITIPGSLVGKPYEAARVQAVGLGLVPKRLDVRSTKTVGLVVDLAPGVGTTLDRGAAITLKVSRGLPRVEVPDVVGQDVDAAREALRQAGFRVQSQSVASDEPRNSIVSEDPPAQSRATEGSTVTLRVSEGPPPVDVPDVVGHERSAAVQMLQNAGLSVGTQTGESSETVPQGDVISMSPGAGETVDKGSRVDLVISSGPKRETVPDVVGLDEESATQALQTAGFNVQPGDRVVSDPAQDGVVIKQSPVGGNRALPGSRIIIVVGRLPSTPPADTGDGATPGQGDSPGP